jgi:hypothetical protein
MFKVLERRSNSTLLFSSVLFSARFICWQNIDEVLPLPIEWW